VSEVTVPDLRNHGGHGIDPVTHGERITITRDARPVAELRPYTKSKVSTEALLTRWRHLPGSTPSPFGLTWTRFSTAGSDDCAGPDPWCPGHFDGHPVAGVERSELLLAEPLMTTVTLAELSVGPLLVVARTDQERAARQAPCNGPKLISTRSRSTLLQPGHSDKSPPRCGEMVARSPLALTTP